MNTMEYKGYTGSVNYSDKDSLLWGKLLGIEDMITYEGESVRELRQDFEQAVEDYLASCKKAGVAPQRPRSGNILLRLSPETHLKAAIKAEAEGVSLNRWLAGAVEMACNS